MHLWLERYVLPVCAAIVFGITVLNPLNFDWQQRLSLLLAISAFAYFVAHTLHQPKAKGSGGSEQRVAFLEQQVEALQSEQKEIADRQTASAQERERRQMIRGRLAQFLKEGQEIQQGLEYNNSSYLEKKNQWEKSVEAYLTSNLDESYTTRFKSPSHQLLATPIGATQQMRDAWAGVGARMAMLNDFMSELRD